MVTPLTTIEKIKAIIKKHYARLAVSILGSPQLTEDELKTLEEAGYDTSNPDSLLSMVYHHAFINHPRDGVSPTTVGEMKDQQRVYGLKPQGEVHDDAVESANEKTHQYIDKLKTDTMTRIENMIRENNQDYRMDALQNPNRADEFDELMRESTVGALKTKLQDSSHEANRDWLRVAVTEMSNAIGIASMDRVLSENHGSNTDEVYVFRIAVNDGATCKYCREFYIDEDGTPKLYRLSTLMGNGSNYNKKTSNWQPVAVATHPNERCSGIMELKPGWALIGNGTPTYIGLDHWAAYIKEKLTA